MEDLFNKLKVYVLLSADSGNQTGIFSGFFFLNLSFCPITCNSSLYVRILCMYEYIINSPRHCMIT